MASIWDFFAPPLPAPPQLPWFAAPRTQQGSYWSMLSPSGELLPVGDAGAVNSPPAPPTWPQESTAYPSVLFAHPVHPPSQRAAPSLPLFQPPPAQFTGTAEGQRQPSAPATMPYPSLPSLLDLFAASVG